jgi:hypothetical protein
MAKLGVKRPVGNKTFEVIITPFACMSLLEVGKGTQRIVLDWEFLTYSASVDVAEDR